MRLVIIKFLFYRGISTTSKCATFRETYSRLHELRTLIPSANFMALTATATEDTKACITDVLLMDNAVEVSSSPNKQNIAYAVKYISKDTKPADCFRWISDRIKENGISSERVLIYCQTIKQCSIIYATIKGLLGDHFFAEQSNKNPRHVLLDMLHSCTPKSNKDSILRSFQELTGCVRVLVATIAFGMGVDCKGVHTTIHFGPPKNIEAYIQESGRAGRDDIPSLSYIIYQGLLLTHVDKEIRNYLKTNSCRRQYLMRYFGISLNNTEIPEPVHACCDKCAEKCSCGASNCKSYCEYPYQLEDTQYSSVNVREVTDDSKKNLEIELIKYHKSILMNMMKKEVGGRMHSIVHLELLIGFGETQIKQILDNCSRLFSPSDICHFVEIWNSHHAVAIHNIIATVFGDVEAIDHDNSQEFDSDDEYEERIMSEWAAMAEDDDLFHMAMENISEVNNSQDLSVDNLTMSVRMPVLQALTNLSLTEGNENI